MRALDPSAWFQAIDDAGDAPFLENGRAQPSPQRRSSDAEEISRRSQSHPPTGNGPQTQPPDAEFEPFHTDG